MYSIHFMYVCIYILICVCVNVCSGSCTHISYCTATILVQHTDIFIQYFMLQRDSLYAKPHSQCYFSKRTYLFFASMIIFFLSLLYFYTIEYGLCCMPPMPEILLGFMLLLMLLLSLLYYSFLFYRYGDCLFCSITLLYC